MISLFLNTCSNYLNIAIIKNNKIIKEKNLELKKDLSALALNEIKKLIEETKLSPKDIDEIYCVNGPGSFTGIRVGVTISKIFAWSLNKKLYKLSNLYVMANSQKADYIIPLIDARRGYVFAGIYDRKYNNIFEDRYILLEDLLKEIKTLKGKIIFVSNDKFEFKTKKYKPNLKRLFKNIKKEEVNPFDFIPNYLKKTEAEENLNNDKRNK